MAYPDNLFYFEKKVPLHQYCVVNGHKLLLVREILVTIRDIVLDVRDNVTVVRDIEVP